MFQMREKNNKQYREAFRLSKLRKQNFLQAENKSKKNQGGLNESLSGKDKGI